MLLLVSVACVHTYTHVIAVLTRRLDRFLHEQLPAVFRLRSSAQRVHRVDVITLETSHSSPKPVLVRMQDGNTVNPRK